MILSCAYTSNAIFHLDLCLSFCGLASVGVDDILSSLVRVREDRGFVPGAGSATCSVQSEECFRDLFFFLCGVLKVSQE